MDQQKKAEFKEEHDRKLKDKDRLKEIVAKLADESGVHVTAVEVATNELKALEKKGHEDSSKTATSKNSPTR